jgi:hypothetical protein
MVPAMRRRPTLVCFAALAATAGVARAEAPSSEGRGAPTVAERPWLHMQDATIPAPGAFVASTGGTYASTNPSVTRPFASNLAGPGGTADASVEAGVLPRLSLHATGVFGGVGASAGLLAGARFAVLAGGPARITLGAGYLRELGGDDGAWVRAIASYDIGALRLATQLHGEKVFAPRRDEVDVMVSAGASLRLSNVVRTGLEYVAQDLEGFFDREEAEGGVRHFFGPTASVELLQKRLVISGGPAMGLSYDSPKILGRLTASYAF